MAQDDMICKNCDYYKPFSKPMTVRISSTEIKTDGACCRHPPQMIRGTEYEDLAPPEGGIPIQSKHDVFFPIAPTVAATYSCGDGKWTGKGKSKPYPYMMPVFKKI